MSAPLPKSILIVRPDTFGDLILFEPVLRLIAERWPQAQQTLLVRPGYDSLASIFPSSLRWRVTSINPFSENPLEVKPQVVALLETLMDLKPEIILAPTINRTWLEVVIGAHFPKARCIALGEGAVDALFTESLELAFQVKREEVFKEVVAVELGSLDFENNYRLAEHLFETPLDRCVPRLEIPPHLTEQAEAVISNLDLANQRWVTVFPAGTANVKIKAWAPEKFAAIISWLRREYHLPVLLLGHETEANLLNKVAELLDPPPPIWLGQDGQIGLLAALLQKAVLYFGNDTSAMHLAAEIGCPTVAIFGGGHWPRFRPAGRQALALIQPMPCFQCGWDCVFGDAPCVKALTIEDAQNALTIALLKGTASFNDVEYTNHLSPEAYLLTDKAAATHQQLQKDRLARQYKIEKLIFQSQALKADCNIKDNEIASLKKETDFKDDEIDALKKETDLKDKEIFSLKNETDAKDIEIAAFKEETDAKDLEILSLKKEADSKDVEIGELKAAANIKDDEINDLKKVCDERENLIFQLSDHIKNYQQIVEQLNRAHTEKDLVIKDLRANAEKHNLLENDFTALQNQFAKIPKDLVEAGPALHDKDVHIRNIETLVWLREQDLAHSRQIIENYRTGYANLEQAKYFGKLLHDKETVIQTLHRACTERESLIRQLVFENAGLGTRLTKLGIAAKAHARIKWWQPLDQWLFKKLVENAEMQIGVLKQHEPRCIVWDRFPKRPHLPSLPKIAMVTPSFGQEKFIESTLLSVLNQDYPRLLYVVQDGGSKDRSPEIIERYAHRLTAWESAPDRGQGDAIVKGFAKIGPQLDPDDLMGWLNSDDLIAPRTLKFIGHYFATHPEVDVVYGHRIIIDELDQEVGRWIMPRHDPKTLEWIDYIPQETVFWRKKLWDLVGGLDPEFQFALDWDLLARFQQANARIVRLPYFLGCFRIHSEQKTSQHIHTTGHDEMNRIRTRFHSTIDYEQIAHYARKARFSGALAARLLALKIRY